MSVLLEEIVALETEAHAVEAPDELQRFHALVFPARHGSKVMRHLGERFRPLSELGFGHLKRMKKHPSTPKTLVALIAPVVVENVETQESLAEIQDLENLFEAELTSVEALKRAPRTRELFETHTKDWPLIFHASVEENAELPPIEATEQEYMAKHLRAAVQTAGQFDASMTTGFCCARGCVIVDPQGSSADGSGEQVAASGDALQQTQYAFRPIFHPVIVAIDVVAVRDRRRDEGVASGRKKQKCATSSSTDDDKDDSKKPRAKAGESYLCTGYDVYLDREPCAMCAMALVHSRARRVVFAHANVTEGALLSVHRLHTIKSLNHRYRVFRLTLSTVEMPSTTHV